MDALTERLRSCFERQDFTGLDELYTDDAVLELHVGTGHDVYRGRPSIIARYTADYAPPATFLRWEVRQAPWGAVVEAAAVQGEGRHQVFFRWVHLLGIENGRISTDSVYCTGAVPAAGDEDHQRSVGSRSSLVTFQTSVARPPRPRRPSRDP